MKLKILLKNTLYKHNHCIVNYINLEHCISLVKYKDPSKYMSKKTLVFYLINALIIFWKVEYA